MNPRECQHGNPAYCRNCDDDGVYGEVEPLSQVTTPREGKRLTAERLAEVHDERRNVWLTPHVTLGELLGHIAAVEAELSETREERLGFIGDLDAERESHERTKRRVDAIEAENTRLREALEKIARNRIGSVRPADYARVALEETP